MARARGNYKHTSSRLSLKPEDIFNRSILIFVEKSDASNFVDLGGYLKTKGVELLSRTVNNHSLYYTACKKENAGNVCKKAERCGFFAKSIPVFLPEDEELVRPYMASVKVDDLSRFSQRSRSGWIYCFRDEDNNTIYVGETADERPVRRVTSHLFEEFDGKDDTLIHLRRYIDEQRNPDWTVDFIQPERCEQLDRKSYFLPGEDVATVWNEAFIAESKKRWNALTSNKRLRRAEDLLIALYHPKFNTRSNPKPFVISPRRRQR